ncbi:MAG TPA: hypothetical protein VLC53_06475, partial [Myxococcota bacterium]|nr:hypothetical protein [Myxococcota bacterium]
MFGAIHRRRRRGRRGGRATLGTALALLLAAWPADAPAERRRDDAPARAWRSLKRVPGQLGAATGRALREFAAGIEQGRRSGARRPPALAPDAEEDPPYPPEAGEDAAFGGLFDSEPAAESEGEPEPSPSERAEASDAAPA